MKNQESESNIFIHFKTTKQLVKQILRGQKYKNIELYSLDIFTYDIDEDVKTDDLYINQYPMIIISNSYDLNFRKTKKEWKMIGAYMMININQENVFDQIQIQEIYDISDLIDIHENIDENIIFKYPISINEDINYSDLHPLFEYLEHEKDVYTTGNITEELHPGLYPPGCDINLCFAAQATGLDIITNCAVNINPIEGVQTSYIYFGYKYSIFPFHTEDFNLASINVLLQGAPKIWFYILPDKYQAVLDCIHAYCYNHDINTCNSHITNGKDLFPDPALFANNGIDVHVCVQKPGQLLYIPSGCFHWGYSAGNNIGIAINVLSMNQKSIGYMKMSLLDSNRCLIDCDRCSNSNNVDPGNANVASMCLNSDDQFYNNFFGYIEKFPKFKKRKKCLAECGTDVDFNDGIVFCDNCIEEGDNIADDDDDIVYSKEEID